MKTRVQDCDQQPLSTDSEASGVRRELVHVYVHEEQSQHHRTLLFTGSACLRLEWKLGVNPFVTVEWSPVIMIAPSSWGGSGPPCQCHWQADCSGRAARWAAGSGPLHCWQAVPASGGHALGAMRWWQAHHHDVAAPAEVTVAEFAALLAAASGSSCSRTPRADGRGRPVGPQQRIRVSTGLGRQSSGLSETRARAMCRGRIGQG